MWVTPASPSRIRVRSSSMCSGRRFVEETASLAEEHRDEMDLELVEEAGGERELRGSGKPGETTRPARFSCARPETDHARFPALGGDDRLDLPASTSEDVRREGPQPRPAGVTVIEPLSKKPSPPSETMPDSAWTPPPYGT